MSCDPTLDNILTWLGTVLRILQQIGLPQHTYRPYSVIRKDVLVFNKLSITPWGRTRSGGRDWRVPNIDTKWKELHGRRRKHPVSTGCEADYTSDLICKLRRNGFGSSGNQTPIPRSSNCRYLVYRPTHSNSPHHWQSGSKTAILSLLMYNINSITGARAALFPVTLLPVYSTAKHFWTAVICA
jgi:hypothetical protein